MIEKKEAGIGKRGQSSIFIIAGIVIVIIIGLVVFFFREDVQVGERITTAQVEPVKEYIEGCVRDELEKDLKLLRSNSGFFGPAQYQRPVGDPTNYIVVNYVIFGRRELPLQGNLEYRIGEDIKRILTSECSLEKFKENFAINEDSLIISTDVSLGNHITTVKVFYPITIKKDDFRSELSEFSVEIEDDFGILFRFIQFIVEKELSGGYSGTDFGSSDFRRIVGDPALFVDPEYDCDDKDFCIGSVGTIKEKNKERVVFAVCKRGCEVYR